MLKLINVSALLFIILLTIDLQTFSQEWSIYTSPRFRQLHDIHFHDPQKLVIVGGHPWNDSITYMAYSETGGADWVRFEDIFPGKLIRSVLFLNQNYGICAGDKSSIFETFDGGLFWSEKQINTDLNYRRINQLIKNENNIIYAVGGQEYDNGFLIKTEDTTESWIMIKEWEENEIFSLEITSQNKMFVCGNNSLLQYSTSFGNYWQNSNILGYASNYNLDLKSIEFVNNLIGYCVGGIINAEDTTGVILKTTDGGLNWNTVFFETDYFFNDISTVNSNFAIAVGDNGLILKTNDAAETWETVIIEDYLGFDIFSANFPSKHFGALTARWGHLLIYNNPDVDFPFATTLNVSNLTQNSAKLNAIINPGGAESKVYFLYGKNLQLENKVLAGTFNGTNNIEVSLDLEDLEHLTDYYFAVKTKSSYGELFGDTLSFHTIPELLKFETKNAADITFYSAILNAEINPANFDCDIFFLIGEDHHNYSDTVFVGNFNGGTTIEVSKSINRLRSNRDYFFKVMMSNILGDFYGETKSFTTNPKPEDFKVLSTGATNVTNTSAQLNAIINTTNIPVNLYFHYGIDENDYISAYYGEYSAGQDNYIYILIENLEPDSLYYYNVTIDSDDFFYESELKPFYTGNPIPNWDFELWTTVKKTTPKNFYSYGGVVKKQYGDQYAVALKPPTSETFYEDYTSGVTSGLYIPASYENGVIDEVQHLLGGYETTAKPNQFHTKIKYNIEHGDSAFIVVLLLQSDNSIVGQSVHFITGHSNNHFIDTTFNIEYSNETLIPEILIVGFINTNPLTDEFSFFENELEIMHFGFDIDTLFVPNSDFSEWGTLTEDFPKYWEFDYKDWPSYDDLYPQPFIKTSDAAHNDFAICLKSIFSDLDTYKGKINTKRFPVNYPHNNFSGYYRFDYDSFDTASIIIEFFYEDELVGRGRINFTEKQEEWEKFSVEINYLNEENFADSARIRIRSSIEDYYTGAKLCIDKLSFDGGFIPVNLIKSNEFNIYPNPFDAKLIIKTNSINEDDLIVEIFDISGKLHYREDYSAINRQQIIINTDFIKSGAYFIRIIGNNFYEIQKIIKM